MLMYDGPAFAARDIHARDETSLRLEERRASARTTNVSSSAQHDPPPDQSFDGFHT